MATGRSRQLDVSRRMESVTSSRVQHVSQASDVTFYLQHRFRDTAVLIFQQQVRKLREVSTGHYTPLSTDSPRPSLQLETSKGLSSMRSPSSSYLPRASGSSSGARTPLRDDSGSLASVERTRYGSSGSSRAKTPTGNGSISSMGRARDDTSYTEGQVEENEESVDPVFVDDAGIMDPDTPNSLSDSSSDSSSAPNSDLYPADVSSSLPETVEVGYLRGSVMDAHLSGAFPDFLHQSPADVEVVQDVVVTGSLDSEEDTSRTLDTHTGAVVSGPAGHDLGSSEQTVSHHHHSHHITPPSPNGQGEVEDSSVSNDEEEFEMTHL